MQVGADAEVLGLRATLRDLVALSAIPATWVGSEPQTVAAGLADVLVGLLQLDFAFVRLSDPGGVEAVEVTRGSPWKGFAELLQSRFATRAPFPRMEVIADAGDESPRRRGVAVPVGVNGEGGVVAGASERSDFPTQVDQLLLSLAANHAAAAFQNARLIHERKRAEEALRTARNDLEVKVTERTAELRVANDALSALRRVATLAAEGVQPQDLFAVVAEEAARVVRVPLVRIVRYEPDDTATECASFSTDGPRSPFGTRSSLEGGNLLRLVRDSFEAARIDDYSGLEGELAENARRLGIRSSVGTPIVVAGRLWGAVVVSSTEEDPLPEDTEARLADFTELLGTAIENAESREALGRLADEQAALRRVATLVARRVQPAEIFAAVSQEVGRLFGTDSAAVARFDHEGPANVVVGVASTVEGVPIGSRWELDDAMASAEVYRSGRSARVDGIDWSTVSGPIGAAARRLGTVSTVCSPIVVDGRLWGNVAVTASEQLPLDTEERLEKFTELLGTAIANTESRDALGRLAEEQVTLRRLATLVARGVPPAEIFSAVSDEAGRLIGSDTAAVVRFEHDPPAIVVVGLGKSIPGIPIGTRSELDDSLASTQVYRTRSSARVDARDWASAVGPLHEPGRRMALSSTVASPIIVEGRLWGTISVSARDPLPPDTERRLERFGQLVATAIANAESREALARLADEQAALRRVATLVARGVRPSEIFSAVSQEVHRMFDLAGEAMDVATVVRFDPGPEFVLVGAATRIEALPLGSRWGPKDLFVSTRVLRTGRSARVDESDLVSVGGPEAETLRRQSVVSQVASPIIVEGQLWGAITVNAKEALPPDAEERLEKFTELVGTAIANAEGKSELAASRRRIVAASDEARAKIERNLHDGTQQRLASLGLALSAAEADIPPGMGGLRADLSRIGTGLEDAMAELQEISRGIHPAILSQGGLGPALRALARRSMIPVALDVGTDTRLPEPIEVAAYFVVSEALANATKHSQASRIDISLGTRRGTLVLSIRDDGVGGAELGRGSGLVGLHDRVEALDGTIDIESAPGRGTSLLVALPIVKTVDVTR